MLFLNRSVEKIIILPDNSIHGGAPIAIFSSSTKLCQLFGDCEIPDFHNMISIDNIVPGIYDDVYTKTEVDAIGDELIHLILNTYTKTETGKLIANSALTSSENIDITNNEMSLTFSLNGEICLHPRAYCSYFEMYAGPSGSTFLQNLVDGAQPIAIFNSLGKSVELFGLDILNFHNKAEVDNFIANINGVNLDNYYI